MKAEWEEGELNLGNEEIKKFDFFDTLLGVIITDIKLALMNAIHKVFLEKIIFFADSIYQKIYLLIVINCLTIKRSIKHSCQLRTSLYTLQMRMSTSKI